MHFSPLLLFYFLFVIFIPAADLIHAATYRRFVFTSTTTASPQRWPADFLDIDASSILPISGSINVDEISSSQLASLVVGSDSTISSRELLITDSVIDIVLFQGTGSYVQQGGVRISGCTIGRIDSLQAEPFHLAAALIITGNTFVGAKESSVAVGIRFRNEISLGASSNFSITHNRFDFPCSLLRNASNMGQADGEVTAIALAKLHLRDDVVQRIDISSNILSVSLIDSSALCRPASGAQMLLMPRSVKAVSFLFFRLPRSQSSGTGSSVKEGVFMDKNELRIVFAAWAANLVPSGLLLIAVDGYYEYSCRNMPAFSQSGNRVLLRGGSGAVSSPSASAAVISVNETAAVRVRMPRTPTGTTYGTDASDGFMFMEQLSFDDNVVEFMQPSTTGKHDFLVLSGSAAAVSFGVRAASGLANITSVSFSRNKLLGSFVGAVSSSSSSSSTRAVVVDLSPSDSCWRFFFSGIFFDDNSVNHTRGVSVVAAILTGNAQNGGVSLWWVPVWGMLRNSIVAEGADIAAVAQIKFGESAIMCEMTTMADEIIRPGGASGRMHRGLGFVGEWRFASNTAVIRKCRSTCHGLGFDTGFGHRVSETAQTLYFFHDNDIDVECALDHARPLRADETASATPTLCAGIIASTNMWPRPPGSASPKIPDAGAYPRELNTGGDGIGQLMVATGNKIRVVASRFPLAQTLGIQLAGTQGTRAPYYTILATHNTIAIALPGAPTWTPGQALLGVSVVMYYQCVLQAITITHNVVIMAPITCPASDMCSGITVSPGTSAVRDTPSQGDDFVHVAQPILVSSNRVSINVVSAKTATEQQEEPTGAVSGVCFTFGDTRRIVSPISADIAPSLADLQRLQAGHVVFPINHSYDPGAVRRGSFLVGKNEINITGAASAARAISVVSTVTFCWRNNITTGCDLEHPNGGEFDFVDNRIMISTSMFSSLSAVVFVGDCQGPVYKVEYVDARLAGGLDVPRTWIRSRSRIVAKQLLIRNNYIVTLNIPAVLGFGGNVTVLDTVLLSEGNYIVLNVSAWARSAYSSLYAPSWSEEAAPSYVVGLISNVYSLSSLSFGTSMSGSPLLLTAIRNLTVVDCELVFLLYSTSAATSSSASPLLGISAAFSLPPAELDGEEFIRRGTWSAADALIDISNTTWNLSTITVDPGAAAAAAAATSPSSSSSIISLRPTSALFFLDRQKADYHDPYPISLILVRGNSRIIFSVDIGPGAVPAARELAFFSLARAPMVQLVVVDSVVGTKSLAPTSSAAVFKTTPNALCTLAAGSSILFSTSEILIDGFEREEQLQQQHLFFIAPSSSSSQDGTPDSLFRLELLRSNFSITGHNTINNFRAATPPATWAGGGREFHVASVCSHLNGLSLKKNAFFFSSAQSTAENRVIINVSCRATETRTLSRSTSIVPLCSALQFMMVASNDGGVSVAQETESQHQQGEVVPSLETLHGRRLEESKLQTNLVRGRVVRLLVVLVLASELDQQREKELSSSSSFSRAARSVPATLPPEGQPQRDAATILRWNMTVLGDDVPHEQREQKKKKKMKLHEIDKHNQPPHLLFTNVSDRLRSLTPGTATALFAQVSSWRAIYVFLRIPSGITVYQTHSVRIALPPSLLNCDNREFFYADSNSGQQSSSSSSSSPSLADGLVVSVDISPPYRFLSREMRSTSRAVAEATLIVSTLLTTNPSMLMRANVVSQLQQFVYCTFSDDEEDLSPTSNPFGLHFGAAQRGAYQRGSVVGAYLFCALLLLAIVGWAKKRETDGTDKKQQLPLLQHMYALSFPSVLYFAVGALLQGCATAGAALLRHRAGGASDVLLGIAGVGLPAGLWCWIWYVLVVEMKENLALGLVEYKTMKTMKSEQQQQQQQPTNDDGREKKQLSGAAALFPECKLCQSQGANTSSSSSSSSRRGGASGCRRDMLPRARSLRAKGMQDVPLLAWLLKSFGEWTTPASSSKKQQRHLLACTASRQQEEEERKQSRRSCCGEHFLAKVRNCIDDSNASGLHLSLVDLGTAAIVSVVSGATPVDADCSFFAAAAIVVAAIPFVYYVVAEPFRRRTTVLFGLSTSFLIILVCVTMGLARITGGHFAAIAVFDLLSFSVNLVLSIKVVVDLTMVFFDVDPNNLISLWWLLKHYALHNEHVLRWWGGGDAEMRQRQGGGGIEMLLLPEQEVMLMSTPRDEPRAPRPRRQAGDAQLNIRNRRIESRCWGENALNL